MKVQKTFIAAVCLAVGTLVWAGPDDHQMPARVDTKEFQQMKQLVGVWKGTKDNSAEGGGKADPVEVDYKLTAGGSTLQETLMPNTPHEMVTMYHDEGGKLTMTHYCMLGNTPHLAVTQSSPKQITFNFVSGGGIDPVKDAHMHALTLEFPDNDHLAHKWGCHQNGKPDTTAEFKLTRVKA